MPKRPTKKTKRICAPKKKALDQTEHLMDILRDELVEHLDGPNYEQEVITHCGINPDLFKHGKEKELGKALNEKFEGSEGECRQNLINILKHRTRGAILMKDMKRTLHLIDKRQKEFNDCIHKNSN